MAKLAYLQILAMLLTFLLNSISLMPSPYLGFAKREMFMNMKKQYLINHIDLPRGITKSVYSSLDTISEIISEDDVLVPISIPTDELPTSISIDELDLSTNVDKINFEDPYCLCTSEGSNTPLIIKKIPKVKPIIKNSNYDNDGSKSDTIIGVNFEDTDVLCTSEGGSWKVQMQNLGEANRDSTVVQDPSFFETFAEVSNIIYKGVSSRISLTSELLRFKSSPSDLVKLCDKIDNSNIDYIDSFLLRWRRHSLLLELLKNNRANYLSTVSFLENRIPRNELPNAQDLLPIETIGDAVADCTLPNVTYSESPLDVFLLGVFRNLVQKEIKWKSSTVGIKGLLEEGRHYMLSVEGTPENQHAFVRRTLAGLMTPVLPPFYRLFMSGIVPCKAKNDPEWLVKFTDIVVDNLPDYLKEKVKPGQQFGPLFYAPFLTSVVTPVFLNFLVGPSTVNYRKDGNLGGILVNKCKFLQESGCKGLCLHQCKLPAEQFFADELGLPLTVSPNFATQECQWSWGEVPLPPAEDPSFPEGCLVDCPTAPIRKSMSSGDSNICSA